MSISNSHPSLQFCKAYKPPFPIDRSWKGGMVSTQRKKKGPTLQPSTLLTSRSSTHAKSKILPPWPPLEEHEQARGVHSLLYFAYMMCVRDLFIGGIIYLAENMFHSFKIPYFTCTMFTKFTYNEYIGPYYLSHVVLRFSPMISPSEQGR
jgi:hypothetical protein